MSNLCGSTNTLPINGIIALNSHEIQPTLSDGSVVLRSGNLNTDLASYPDATRTPIGVVTDHTNFAVGNGETEPYGVSVDDNYIYVVGVTTDKVWIYDKTDALAGTATNIANFAVGNGETSPCGVSVDDNYIYVVGITTDKVWIYNRNNGVGILTTKTDTDTGLPIYIRIK